MKKFSPPEMKEVSFSTPHTLHPTPYTPHPTPHTLFQVRNIVYSKLLSCYQVRISKIPDKFDIIRGYTDIVVVCCLFSSPSLLSPENETFLPHH